MRERWDFSAAALSLKARDRWIGWSHAARQAYLRYVVANSRFVIARQVKVVNLASKVLAMAQKRLAKDWQQTYGYRPLLLETYVESKRFEATCYRAANWIHVGRTRGRGRQDHAHRAWVPDQGYSIFMRWIAIATRGCARSLARHGARQPNARSHPSLRTIGQRRSLGRFDCVMAAIESAFLPWRAISTLSLRPIFHRPAAAAPKPKALIGSLSTRP